MTPGSYIAILKVLFGLGAVIFVHELGHFLLAKACGVKCEKFYVGFDVPIKLFGQTIIPAKLVHFQWGETEYGIGAIPLGGYVKMLGQDDNPGNLEEQIKESMVEGETTDSALLPSGLVDQSKLDPRSYLAKSVIQRMLIISAGVIFNLLFAIVFAAFAFKSGVDYSPAIIGNVTGSGPAWKHDLAGAEVERINDTEAEGYFPYMNMAEAIIFGASEGPVELEYKPYGESESKVIKIDGERGIVRAIKDLPLIGVGNRMTAVVGDTGALAGKPASRANPPFEAGDKIIEINGTPINSDIDLRTVLARDADLTAKFVLERKSGEIVTTEVAAPPMNRLGFGVEWLPVSAIKIGSPADGELEVGDEIVSINGTTRGDFLMLDKFLMNVAKEGGTVDIGIKRGDEEKTLTLSPIVPRTLSDVGPNRAFAIDTLGFAIPMTLKIESVIAGSSASDAGMQVGDELISLEYVLSDKQKENSFYSGLVKKPVVNFEEDETNWAEVSSVLQLLDTGTDMKLTFLRGQLEQTASMKLEPSDEFYFNQRGISLVPLQHNYISDTWGDAFKYGYYQVGKDLKRVFTTLAKLIKGKISPTNLGGPGTIALVATSEASESTSRLLLFLTFLSANLAIINFLPIPVLDGGHMLFLAYEGIFRRPVSERVQMVLTYTGLIMILSLMVFVLSLDAGRMFSLF